MPTLLAAIGIGIPWPVSFSTSRSLAMICSTVCFLVGTVTPFWSSHFR